MSISSKFDHHKLLPKLISEYLSLFPLKPQPGLNPRPPPDQILRANRTNMLAQRFLRTVSRFHDPLHITPRGVRESGRDQ